MLPARFAPVLFVFLLSGIMSGIVIMVATLRTRGFSAQAFDTWLTSWLIAGQWPSAWCLWWRRWCGVL